MTQANGRDLRDGGAVDVHQIADTLWKLFRATYQPGIVQAPALLATTIQATEEVSLDRKPGDHAK